MPAFLFFFLFIYMYLGGQKGGENVYITFKNLGTTRVTSQIIFHSTIFNWAKKYPTVLSHHRSILWRWDLYQWVWIFILCIKHIFVPVYILQTLERNRKTLHIFQISRHGRSLTYLGSVSCQPDYNFLLNEAINIFFGIISIIGRNPGEYGGGGIYPPLFGNAPTDFHFFTQ